MYKKIEKVIKICYTYNGGDRMKCLEYPFNSQFILKNKKTIKKELMQEEDLLEKRIAILGGSTTSEIKNILEIFLLNYKIKALFYESEYNQYYQDIMFENKSLEQFKPDIIFIHTTNRNITSYPTLMDTESDIELLLNNETKKFYDMWDTCFKKYNCPIIQNNMELPYYRVLGNKEVSDIHGKINYINKLNMKFYEYANTHQNFYINDINYLSSMYGLNKWADQFYWYMYKYALSVNAIPYLSFNIANIIKAIYGKNKKALVLDLDNTLWGGVIGDDGQENIVLGPETSTGQAYLEFQRYLLELKNKGIILNINSKNDFENAILGLEHPDSILKKDDFVIVKANWQPKSQNMKEIANELSLGIDSFVFVDDNPAERLIIERETPQVVSPEIDNVEHYIRILDSGGYFETTELSTEDFQKTEMYHSNLKREELLNSVENYDDYLKSLKMKAIIKDFEKIYVPRISQLSNKSNQFNLTTHRYTENEIEKIMLDDNYISIYGKLIDCFGDNGVVSVIIGEKKNKELHIDLWIMSCRVLKRDMEYAMLDQLVEKARHKGIEKIIGYYYPTKKNGMVKEFYKSLGFDLVSCDENGNSTWELSLKKSYKNKNKFIEVENGRNIQ